MHPLFKSEDAVQYHEVHALVIKAVMIGAQLFTPVVAKVNIVVMLAHNVMGLCTQARKYLQAMINFLRFTKLCNITTVENKIRFRVHQVGFCDGTNQATVPVINELLALDMSDVRVRNKGKGKVLATVFSKGDFHQADGKTAGRQQCATIFQ